MYRLDKKDAFLGTAIKGTDFEKPFSKLINGFFNLTGKDKINQIISDYLKQSEYIDVNKLSEDARKAVFVKCLLRAANKVMDESVILGAQTDYTDQKNFFRLMVCTLNTMLYEQEENLNGVDRRREVISSLEREIFVDDNNQEEVEDYDNNQNDEDNIIIQKEEQQPKEAVNTNTDPSKINFNSYAEIKKYYIEPNKFFRFFDASRLETLESVITKKVKEELLKLKSFNADNVALVKNKSGVLNGLIYHNEKYGAFYRTKYR